ncbi:MAG: 23S rRNA (adenine(2503)-C(2))-methyltransferase RlmN [Anaerovoracaceae bacterium]|jgi:23S rRNA (adenine2503-C2)-methyltransferase
MTDLKNMTLEELEGWFAAQGEKPFRARQVYRWIYRGKQDFGEMTDLSLALREKLAHTACIGSLETVTVQESAGDGTRKFLFQLEDGNRIETVFMKYSYGNSICISSQAGCRMGCIFCASTRNGLARNLTAGEMADQIICVQRYTGEKINHIVVMGSGEPMENYQQLDRFITMVHEKDGLGIGSRNITVSTCGLIPGIERMAEDHPQVNIAVSLHAADDETREKIMPVNRKYGLEELLAACREHIEKTGRRMTFEYALIKDVNDRRKDIDLLAKRLHGMNCHVNLIPLNEVSESGLRGSGRKKAAEIADHLVSMGIQATVRRELGSDIDAACGQLRLRKK